MGKTMNEIGKTLFPNLTEERRQQIIADFGNEEINYLSQKGAILYEGLEETLKILSLDYNLYIVSNCQDGYVEAFLHAHQLKSYFKDYEMSGYDYKVIEPMIKRVRELLMDDTALQSIADNAYELCMVEHTWENVTYSLMNQGIL